MNVCETRTRRQQWIRNNAAAAIAMIAVVTKRLGNRDILEVACDGIWVQICSMIPRHRYLHDLGAQRTREQTEELSSVCSRIAVLRRRSNRFREILRDEAWARYHQADEENDA